MLRSIVLALSVVLVSGSMSLAQSSTQALKVGDTAPDFKVETFGGESITLSDRYGDDGKVSVLLFSRANW